MSTKLIECRFLQKREYLIVKVNKQKEQLPYLAN